MELTARILCVVCALVGASMAVGDKARLMMNSTGEFKLAIFADLHYGEGESTEWGPEQDANSTVVMEKMLIMENPDFVVYSGDQVTGENIDSNATAYWAKLVQPCIISSTRWAVIFGNHDDKSASDGTREDLLKFDTSFPFSYSQFGPSELHGLTNYYLLIYSSKSAQTPAWVLYMLDSGGGSYPQLVYDDQIKWLVTTAKELTTKYGAIPAVAFFHIPSTEYQGVYAKSLCDGTDNDTVSPQLQPNKLVSTLFTEAGVRVTVVGHNHGNDWCCPYKASDHMTRDRDHMICFARHTGYGGYGTWMRGSRVLVLKENGQYETYVRMEDGRILSSTP